MNPGVRRHRVLFTIAVLALLVASAAAGMSAGVQAAETPRRGGILLAVIAAEPPSLDPHQEGTFANIQLVAPCYSLLLQFDPQDFSKIIGDVATDWKIAPDGRAYTFKIRQGIRFHDGSAMTSADIKASYDKIIFPPEGVRSTRKTSYSAGEGEELRRPAQSILQPEAPGRLARGGLRWCEDIPLLGDRGSFGPIPF